MSERKVIHGAVMAECFHPGFGGLDADLLTDQEPRTGQVAVVVMRAEDYAALTADRDRYREALEDQIRATAYAHLKRTDAVSLCEQRGELMQYAAPLSRHALNREE